MCNRYSDAPIPVYAHLLSLIVDKNYFVLTTNVDHMFQKSGFDRGRLFYTQGDYGLWQCSKACHAVTYDNESRVRDMASMQHDMKIPSGLIPHCLVCGAPIAMNLRCDDTFVQDAGWHVAQRRYSEFASGHARGKTLYFELGVGQNTPGIIKYPFWHHVLNNADAIYACINLNQAYAPSKIAARSICLNMDIWQALSALSCMA